MNFSSQRNTNLIRIVLIALFFLGNFGVMGAQIFAQEENNNNTEATPPKKEEIDYNEIYEKALEADEYQDASGIVPSGYYYDSSGKRYEIEGQLGDIGRRLDNGSLRLTDIPIFIVRVIDFVSKLAGTLAVVALIIGGVQLMMGELAETQESAKKTIKYAIVGIIVTFISWLVINLIKTQLTGVDNLGEKTNETKYLELIEQKKN